MGSTARSRKDDELDRTASSARTERRRFGYEGATLGGFRLSRGIASGGMATVYLGAKLHEAGIQQLAAVKVIHPHLARDQEFVDMFLDEARIASCIHHPNVCRVTDFGKHDGTYFLAMEYISGETWADVLTRMTASGETTDVIHATLAYVLAQACEGLHAAHEATDAQGNWLRIVHRDISPQNVMIGYDGSVRVLDFGIASAADRLHTTRNGVVKGRLSYMAPEQMRGAPVDRRADVWSLGVMLWEGLAGQGLFTRNSEAETVLAVTSDPIPFVAERAPGAPLALEHIISRTLQRDVDARLGSARELGLALRRWASKSPVSIGAPELSERMHRSFADEITVKRALTFRTAELAEEHPRASGVPPVAHSSPTADRPQRVMTHGPSTDSTVSGYRRVLMEGRRLGSTTPAVAAFSLFAAWLVVAAAQSVGGTGAPTLSDEAMETRANGLPADADSAKAKPPSSLTSASEQSPERPLAGEPTFDGEVDFAFDLAEVERMEQAPAEPRARASHLAKTGTLNVATPGTWAEIYLGARKLGTTPLQLTLPAGAHTLRLRPSGQGPDIVRRVRVEPSATTRLAVSFD